MAALKHNLLVQFSLLSIGIMIVLAVLISTILTVRLERHLDQMGNHHTAMMAGARIDPADPVSIARLSGDIRELQWITNGALTGGFVVMYVSLVAIVWRGWRTIIRQQKQLEVVNSELEVKVAELRVSNHLVNAEIAQRRRVEGEIRLQSEITANMAEGVYLIRTSDGMIVYTNSKFDEMFGYEQGELVGKYVSAVNAPGGKTPEEVPREIIESLNENGGWTGEVQNIKKDGETFWCRASVSTFDHHEFGPVWVSVHTDITERKRAEEALTRQNELLQSIFDNIPVMLSVYDRSGRVEFINRAVESTLGWSFEDWQSRDLMAECYPDPGYREEVTNYMLENSIEWRDFNTRTRDGHTIDTSWYNVRLSNGSSIGIGQDITERKRREKALRESEEEARRLAQENTSLAEIGRIISSSLVIEEVYQRFTNEVRKLITFDRIVVSLVDLEQGTYSPAYVEGTDVVGRGVGVIIPLAGSATEEVLRRRSAVRVEAGDDEDILSRYPATKTSNLAGLRSAIAVPLISQDEVIGCLLLRSMDRNNYTEADLALLESVGAQIAGAIANAQLYEARKQAEEEERRAAQENRAMAEIGRIISSSLDINEYDLLGEEIKGLISFDRMSLSLVDREDGVEVSTWVTGVDVPSRRPGDLRPIEGTLAGEVMRINSPMLVEADTEADLDHLPGLRPNFHVGMRSFMAAPLFYRGTPIAVLQVRSRHTGVYSQRDLDILGRVGNQIAGAVANSQLYAERTRLANENLAMAGIGRVISSSLDISEVYDRLGQEVQRLIPFDRMSLSLIDHENGVSSQIWVFGTSVPGRGPGNKVPLAGTIAEVAIQGRSPTMLETEDETDLILRFPQLLSSFHAGHRSFLAVPLFHRDDVIAVLQLHSKKQGIYSQQHLDLAERVGNQIAGAIANAQLYAEGKQGEEALRISEQRIRELAKASVQAHEEDRQWIALEVHDRISQPLFAVFQQLLKLEAMTRDDPQAQQEAKRASAILNQAIRESRNIMNDLYPAGLDEFGVVTLIEEELERLQEDTGCTARVDDDCPGRAPREVEITLYRIFHEALINIRRHAPGVRNVSVLLSYRDQLAVLQVGDNGPGFDVTPAARGLVGGLMAMRRRAEVIGGTLDINSAPGRGTFLTVRVPIRDTSE